MWQSITSESNSCLYVSAMLALYRFFQSKGVSFLLDSENERCLAIKERRLLLIQSIDLVSESGTKDGNPDPRTVRTTGAKDAQMTQTLLVNNGPVDLFKSTLISVLDTDTVSMKESKDHRVLVHANLCERHPQDPSRIILTPVSESLADYYSLSVKGTMGNDLMLFAIAEAYGVCVNVKNTTAHAVRSLVPRERTFVPSFLPHLFNTLSNTICLKYSGSHYELLEQTVHEMPLHKRSRIK